MFINENVSQNDANRFQLDELWNKYNQTNGTYEHRWTVDKSTDNWLFPVKKLSGFEVIWIFHYKDTNIEIKLYKSDDGWDLLSIKENPYDNQEVISTLRDALKVLAGTDIKDPKERVVKQPKEKSAKKTIEPKKTSKRKIPYLNILTAAVGVVILFYIANDKKISSVIKNDYNQSTKKIQTTKPKYDIYSVVQTSNNENGIFGISKENLNKRTEILHFNALLSTSKVDKYGNIYWGNWSKKAIFKANSDGKNIRKILTVPDGPGDIAIDSTGERIFWAQWLPDKKYGEIAYSDLSGNNKHIILSNKSVMKSARGLFYDYVNDKLYISDLSGGKILVMDLKTKKVTRLAYSSQPSKIVVDYKNKRVIWTDTVTDNISSIDFDGSNRKTLIQFDDKFSNPTALTIDTSRNRLIYEYYNSSHGSVMESSKLNGTDKKIENKTHYIEIKSLYFVPNDNDIVDLQETKRKKSKTVASKQIPYNIAKLKSCLACHGQNWSRAALGKSKIVRNMSQKNIYQALIGYKNGTYGGPMKGVMKGQVARYSDAELEQISQAITTWQ